MPDAAVYTRISSDPGGSALGVARQETDCRALAVQKGWKIAAVFTDNDVSATSKQPRPAYRRLLNDIAEGRIAAVVVWDLDRLHRRPIELEEFLDLADRHHVALASVGGEVDLATPQGRMIARIKGAVARQEAEQISRRVRRKQLELAEAGKVGNGGIRPYGYEHDRVTVREDEAAIIREIAQRVLAGETTRGVAADLTTRGVATVKGGSWAPTSVRELLLGPRVAGLRRYQGQVIGRAEWPAILDQDTWGAVGAVLRHPDRLRHAVTNARKHLLSGLAACGVCGAKVRVHHGGPTAPLSYACAGRGCVRRSLPHVDIFISELVVTRLAKPDAAELFAGEDSEEARSLASKIAAIHARLDQAVAEFADDDAVTPDQLRAITARLRDRLGELQADQLQRARRGVLRGLVGVNGLAELWSELPLSRRRAVIDSLMSVSILPSKRGRGFDPQTVRVEWRS